ncbi:MAG: hypothetical protein KGL39_20415 [Patescibacteria group bacterium]|nr:hypothetical protein [Patescibacteria group bacterium]
MNFTQIFSNMLSGASNGAVQALQSTPSGQKVNWQSVGIVAAFGAIVGLSQALASHPTVAPQAAAVQNSLPTSTPAAS